MNQKMRDEQHIDGKRKCNDLIKIELKSAKPVPKNKQEPIREWIQM